jgi:hypothetical protein
MDAHEVEGELNRCPQEELEHGRLLAGFSRDALRLCGVFSASASVRPSKRR